MIRFYSVPLHAMRRFLLFLAVALMTFMALTSCSNDDSAEDKKQEYTGVPLVIFDTDIGSSTDDLIALQLLHHYQDEGRCKLLGVVVDRMGEDYAKCADVMNTYYGHGDVPIGLERNGIENPVVFFKYGHLRDLTDDDGQRLFATSVNDYTALPDGCKLYRQVLAAQPDHSVSICSVGFVTSLAHLLESQADEYSSLSGVELVRRKVKCLYLMAGIFTSSEEPEYNFAQGVSFAQTFFQLWPTDVDIMFSPMEVGNSIDYKKDQVIADLSWADRHPIKWIYENIYVDGDGQKMWDPLTVIQAIDGDALFSLSERGIVTLTPKAETIFTPSATGHCRTQQPGTTAWNYTMLEIIRNYTRMSVPFK